MLFGSTLAMEIGSEGAGMLTLGAGAGALPGAEPGAGGIEPSPG